MMLHFAEHRITMNSLIPEFTDRSVVSPLSLKKYSCEHFNLTAVNRKITIQYKEGNVMNKLTI